MLSARLDRGRVSRTDVRVRVADNAGNEVSGLPPRITVTGVRKAAGCATAGCGCRSGAAPCSGAG